ncbi:hypothetical protein C6A37_02590 [Desulfobacteraceae bacterium SEEP-SAG9]|nr:hypothetical protein C6A37_02590 [Desulfobacteraceae bacterium SEEP-SAG9]
MTGLIPVRVAQRIYDEFFLTQHGGENGSGVQVVFIVPESYPPNTHFFVKRVSQHFHFYKKTFGPDSKPEISVNTSTGSKIAWV